MFSKREYKLRLYELTFLKGQRGAQTGREAREGTGQREAERHDFRRGLGAGGPLGALSPCLSPVWPCGPGRWGLGASRVSRVARAASRGGRGAGDWRPRLSSTPCPSTFLSSCAVRASRNTANQNSKPETISRRLALSHSLQCENARPGVLGDRSRVYNLKVAALKPTPHEPPAVFVGRPRPASDWIHG